MNQSVFVSFPERTAACSLIENFTTEAFGIAVNSCLGSRSWPIDLAPAQLGGGNWWRRGAKRVQVPAGLKMAMSDVLKDVPSPARKSSG